MPWQAPPIERQQPPSAANEREMLEAWRMTEVERAWFRRRVGTEDVPFVYCTGAEPDADFDNVDTADPESDFATYLQELDLARADLLRERIDGAIGA